MKNQKNKSQAGKGFYAAIGISTVMIGSACWFAYDQGNKIVDDFNASKKSISDIQTPVDRKITNIPKTTTTAYLARAVTTTAAHSHARTVIETQPEIQVSAEEEAADVMEIVPDEAVETAANFENVLPPLADISNIITPFSGTELVKNETTGSWQTHNGTDIGADIGSKVFAVSDGEITSVSTDPLWGVTVTLDHHNGFVTKYCGLGSDLSVQQGDKLSSGDVIGAVGNTADIESSSPSHLHIEITHNGKFIDPLTAVK